jgi:hypothetical protein
LYFSTRQELRQISIIRTSDPAHLSLSECAVAPGLFPAMPGISVPSRIDAESQ